MKAYKAIVYGSISISEINVTRLTDSRYYYMHGKNEVWSKLTTDSSAVRLTENECIQWAHEKISASLVSAQRRLKEAQTNMDNFKAKYL
jgi:hypothetical protein